MKKFLYFIGDAFSRELYAHFKHIEQIEFVPIHKHDNIDFKNMNGLIYTPSLYFKEKNILESLPKNLKKIAILDLFHFDFKDYLLSFKMFPPDLLFTPRNPEYFIKDIVTIPSFVQEIYSLKNIPKNADMNFSDVCFISQPLLEERFLSFNQHDLILKLQIHLKELAPSIKIFVKPHPRENLSLHKKYHLVQGTPQDILASFHYFTGFNSALLYAAEGLEKSVYKISSLNEITILTLKDFLSNKHQLAQRRIGPSPSIILTQKLNLLK